MKMVNNPAMHEIFVNWFCMRQNYGRTRKKAWKMATKTGKIAPEVLNYCGFRVIVVFFQVLQWRLAEVLFKKFGKIPGI